MTQQMGCSTLVEPLTCMLHCMILNNTDLCCHVTHITRMNKHMYSRQLAGRLSVQIASAACLEESSSQCNSLLFTTTQLQPSLTHHCIIPASHMLHNDVLSRFDSKPATRMLWASLDRLLIILSLAKLCVLKALKLGACTVMACKQSSVA